MVYNLKICTNGYDDKLNSIQFTNFYRAYNLICHRT
jgi:hypothetical protein